MFYGRNNNRILFWTGFAVIFIGLAIVFVGILSIKAKIK
jgi:hypothetical protein